MWPPSPPARVGARARLTFVVRRQARRHRDLHPRPQGGQGGDGPHVLDDPGEHYDPPRGSAVISRSGPTRRTEGKARRFPDDRGRPPPPANPAGDPAPPLDQEGAPPLRPESGQEMVRPHGPAAGGEADHAGPSVPHRPQVALRHPLRASDDHPAPPAPPPPLPGDPAGSAAGGRDLPVEGTRQLHRDERLPRDDPPAEPPV